MPILLKMTGNAGCVRDDVRAVERFRASAGDNAEIMPDARTGDTEKSFPQFRTFAERA
jgi:hypothetical protein